MSEDFEIELLDETEEQEPEVQLPMNYITVGEVGMDDICVYIRQDVFKKLEEYSASDVEHELGSVLLGTYTQAMNKTHIIISEYIEAKYTDASASTLTFTHESWEYIHKEHEENYPDLKILGWQHTHPGYGIFLSNYDMFIQENFFNLPFQTAYVIDPKQKVRGFFQWKDEKVEKLKGFYVYDEVGTPVKVDLSKAEEQKPEVKDTSKLPKYITIALSVIIVFLAGMVFSLSSQIKQQNKNMKYLETAVNNQGEVIFQLQRNNATTATTAAETDGVSFKKYTVKSGDTLSSICKDNGLDYSANIGVIKSLNSIENVDQICVGQVLILPDYE